VSGAALLALAAACNRGPPGQDEIKFSHAVHADAKVACGRCHRTAAGPDFKPSMAVCVSCHQYWKASNRCDKCHQDVRYAKHWLSKS